MINSNYNNFISNSNGYFYNNSSCAYDVQNNLTYSDKKFVNELAKDRQFGTSNVHPFKHNLNSFSDRMYRDAITEASRAKTMGYFNQSKESTVSNNSSTSFHQKLDTPSTTIGNLPELETETISNNSLDSTKNVKLSTDSNVSYVDFGNVSHKQNDLNIINSAYHQTSNKYDVILDQVENNIKQDIQTQIVDDNKCNIRKQTNVKINNIPYKPTKQYTTSSTSHQQNLKIRNNKKEHAENKHRLSPIIWIISIPFLIMPIFGFIISLIVSLAVPKSTAFKIFTRFCLICHLITSFILIYLYYLGKIDITIINNIVDYLRGILNVCR